MKDSFVPESPAQLTVLDSELNHFVFGHWHNVNVTVWQHQATGKAVARFTKVVEALTRQHPTGLSSIHLIANRAGVPTAEARAGFLQLMKRYEKDLANVAIIIAGSGFWASTMGSVITGMRLLAPMSFGFRIFNNIDESAPWLAEGHSKKTGVTLDEAQLVTVLKSAQHEYLDSVAK
jgi:hypothetical protein